METRTRTSPPMPRLQGFEPTVRDGDIFSGKITSPPPIKRFKPTVRDGDQKLLKSCMFVKGFHNPHLAYNKLYDCYFAPHSPIPLCPSLFCLCASYLPYCFLHSSFLSHFLPCSLWRQFLSKASFPAKSTS